MFRPAAVFACALVGLTFAVSPVGATPARQATGSSTITIPFKAGHASIARFKVTVTPKNNGPTTGLPFKLSVGNLAKLSPKIRISAIGGQTGQSITPHSNGPPTTKMIYTVLVAIDATSVRTVAMAHAPPENLLDLIVLSAFANGESPVPCRDVTSLVTTFASIPISHIASSNLAAFKAAVKIACP